VLHPDGDYSFRMFLARNGCFHKCLLYFYFDLFSFCLFREDVNLLAMKTADTLS
jgi:hypothetical protein